MHKHISYAHWVNKATIWAGSLPVVTAALVSIIVYVLVGFCFRFSEAYNMVANTIMSAVSYLLLFIIQHTQNIESRATQVKLDELIYAVKKADNRVIKLEDLEEEQIAELEERCRKRRGI